MRNNSGRAAAAIPGYLAGTWKVDPKHSKIAFSVRQLGLKVRGQFTRSDITIITGHDPLDSSVTATIELASLDTGNEKRDAHIRSETFFDVADHPTASYRSTGIRRAGEGWVIDGELTLHGITRKVPLAVTATGFGPGENDPDGGRRAGFSATAQVSRGDFGIDRWTGGGLVVSDKVPISFEIQAIQAVPR
jgi:polyisoprenoid-binding protein YceI